MVRADYTLTNRLSFAADSYPTVAAAAATGDLGFSSGPWTSTAADGEKGYGDYLTVWKRDEKCAWVVAHETVVTHAAPAFAAAKLSADDVTMPTGAAPPAKFLAADDVDKALEDFQTTSLEDGFPGGLRTFARNYDFGFLTDGEAPMTLDGANAYLTQHLLRGEWQEQDRGKSRDSLFLYSIGNLVDVKRQVNHPYVQIWQFDPKVVNWGLRVLLFGR